MLLEGLFKSGLPFIFKGGTALMLLMNSAKRLSIDIDIILFLDILFEANHYTNIIQHEVNSSFLITSAKPASVGI